MNKNTINNFITNKFVNKHLNYTKLDFDLGNIEKDKYFKFIENIYNKLNKDIKDLGAITRSIDKFYFNTYPISWSSDPSFIPTNLPIRGFMDIQFNLSYKFIDPDKAESLFTNNIRELIVNEDYDNCYILQDIISLMDSYDINKFSVRYEINKEGNNHIELRIGKNDIDSFNVYWFRAFLNDIILDNKQLNKRNDKYDKQNNTWYNKYIKYMLESHVLIDGRIEKLIKQ